MTQDRTHLQLVTSNGVEQAVTPRPKGSVDVIHNEDGSCALDACVPVEPWAMELRKSHPNKIRCIAGGNGMSLLEVRSITAAEAYAFKARFDSQAA